MRLGNNDVRHRSSGYVSHVIVMIQENRSFDNLFATYPGADGTTTGKMQGKHGQRRIPLQEANLTEPCDFGHSYSGFMKDLDGGKMDGFNTEGGGNGSACAGPAGKHPYQYVNPQQIAPYWDIANQYVLADEMFQTQGSGKLYRPSRSHPRRYDDRPAANDQPGRFSLDHALGLRRSLDHENAGAHMGTPSPHARRRRPSAVHDRLSVAGGLLPDAARSPRRTEHLVEILLSAG